MGSIQKRHLDGEVLGACLLGILESLSPTHILPPELIPFSVDGLLPEAWYPYDYLVKLNWLIEDQIAHSDSILFWAGVRFIHIWYWQGPGKEMIQSGLDWVYCNDKGGGYNSVVRGKNIGWCRNRLTDEAEGIALVENVTPLSPAYIRGIYFGGFFLFDDMSYFNAEIESVTHNPDQPFECTVIKLTFKQSDSSISASRLEQLRNVDSPIEAISGAETVELLWRYRHQLNLSRSLYDYNSNIADLTGQAFQNLYALKVNLAEANLKLASEATTDSVTGLRNKRYFESEIVGVLNSAKREQHSVCVMMMDIDYFKRFNDHYGHLAGDAAIKSVAECISGNISRAGDLIARFGGEEFVAVIINVNEDTVRMLATKVAAALSAKKIPHEKSDAAPLLTISIGSVIGKNTFDIQALLQQADEALYRAKERGRNCHVHASFRPC